MKINPTLVILLLLFLCHSAFSQIQNETYTDCDNNTESIHAVLGTGQSLIIASKGFDCSICMNQAPSIQTFAAAQPDVRVWGAMGFRYSSATPTCTGVNNWKNAYAWNDIFMFTDVNNDWRGQGYPTYYVFSAIDSQKVYEGPSFTAATDSALAHRKLINTTTSISTIQRDDCKLSVRQNMIALSCHSFHAEKLNFVLMNLSGQKIFEGVSENGSQISIPHEIVSGIYLLTVLNRNIPVVKGKIFMP